MATNTATIPADQYQPEQPELLHNPRSKIIETIEYQVCKSVAIETAETVDNLAKCHPQDTSPLFALLPRELRDLIWVFATAPFEDEKHKYNTNEYYYRPGHTARLKTHTELLLTCRRVWLEANVYPMLQAEHCFWYNRPAPDAREPGWLEQLTPLNRQNFGHLHLYAQMCNIEPLKSRKGGLRDMFLHTPQERKDFQPRMLHVTIRHTDWWDWESEQPLRFQDSWLQALLDSEDLRSTQTLKLELETLDYKVSQVLPIVERLQRLESKEFETHIVDGQPARTKFVLHGDPQISNWSGPTDINGQSFSPYEGKDKLNYHVITLTWRLHFPDFPHGHVQELRLASRIGDIEPTTNNSSLIEKFPSKPRKLTQAYLIRGQSGRFRRARYSPFNQNFSKPNSIEKMVVDEEDLWNVSAWNAAVQETIRRQHFRKAMGRVHAAKWERKWHEQKALLTFIE